MMGSWDYNKERIVRQNLLTSLKKDVKQLMEISVTCKFIQEDNSCINSFCVSIDSCLTHGLKKDFFFNENTSFNLLKKLKSRSKIVKQIVNFCVDLEKHDFIIDSNYIESFKMKSNDDILTSETDNGSPNSGKKFMKFLSLQLDSLASTLTSSSSNSPTQTRTTNKHISKLFNINSNNYKFIWIKIALLNKCLMDVVNLILNSSNKYYLPYALVADPLDSNLFNSLLSGTCMFDFTRIKAVNDFWSDPNADELINRHKLMTSTRNGTGTYRDIHNSKEYVESIHQNQKSQLLYAKNNILVNQRENSLAGYLSLHSDFNGLILKWTPNKLLDCTSSSNEETRVTLKHQKESVECWKNTLNIDLNTIIYLHCHQDSGMDSSVVLVTHDGLQHPPIFFPKGTHLFQFLSCLETGLLPNFKLVPETWSSTIDSLDEPFVLEKVLINSSSDESYSYYEYDVEQERYASLLSDNQNLNNSSTKIANIFLSPINNRVREMFSTSIDQLNLTVEEREHPSASSNYNTRERLTLKSLCYEMKEKLVSRVFNRWLTYHRHLKLARASLVDLISTNADVINPNFTNDLTLKMSNYLSEGKKLDVDIWNEIKASNGQFDLKLFHKIIYLNGIADNNLRKLVWPYIMEHYDFKMSDKEVEMKYNRLDEEFMAMKNEWKLWEDYIKQKEKRKQEQMLQMTPMIINSNNNSNTNTNCNMGDDDSGISSDISSRSSSTSMVVKRKDINSAGNNKNEHQSPSMGANNSSVAKNKRLSFSSLYAKKQKQGHTPVTIMSSKNEETSEKLNYIPANRESSEKSNQNLRRNIFKSLFNLNKNDAHISSINNDHLSFLNNFSAKNLFSKLINSNESELENEVESMADKTPNITNRSHFSNKFSDFDYEDVEEAYDMQTKELAELLVSNAIFRAGHQVYGDLIEAAQTNKIFEINHVVSGGSNTNSLTSSIIFSMDEKDNEMLLTSSALNEFNEMSSYNITPNNQYSLQSSITNSETNSMTKSAKAAEVKANEVNMFEKDKKLVDYFSLNIHRVDKDVARCDRNYFYFSTDENLIKLKNIMYTYVWENRNIGYMQGMCDLVAPLLVLFDDESLAYNCFKKLMERMIVHFMDSSEIEKNFSRMLTYMQIVDADLYDYMTNFCENERFYFGYRWFLLDFKRELLYDDIFKVWETIWSSRHVYTDNYPFFLALSLILCYRQIIIENNMNYTDMIKFFNEMAEKHNVSEVNGTARRLVQSLMKLLSVKN